MYIQIVHILPYFLCRDVLRPAITKWSKETIHNFNVGMFPSMYIMYTPRSYQVCIRSDSLSDLIQVWWSDCIIYFWQHFDTDLLFCVSWYDTDCAKMYDSYLTSDLTTHLIQSPTPGCVQVCAMLHVHVHACMYVCMYVCMEFLFSSPHPVTVHF